MANDEIEVPVWYRSGGMIVRRDSLDVDHPESTYSYIKNVLGKDPEDYGYYAAHLSEEQKALLATIPDDAIYAEASRRERRFVSKEMFGDC